MLYGETTINTHTPTTKKSTSSLGHQAIAPILPSNFHLPASLPTVISQTLTTPLSSPLATHVPSGLIATVLTLVPCSCLSNSNTGKGFSSCGDGNEGSRDSGSMFSFFLWILGARYKSSSRENLSWMNWSYPGTSRSEPNFCGKKSLSLSSFSVFSQVLFSSAVGRYSSGGLYDSACPGRETFGAGRGGG